MLDLDKIDEFLQGERFFQGDAGFDWENIPKWVKGNKETSVPPPGDPTVPVAPSGAAAETAGDGRQKRVGARTSGEIGRELLTIAAGNCKFSVD
jgi:hypothetical protein